MVFFQKNLMMIPVIYVISGILLWLVCHEIVNEIFNHRLKKRLPDFTPREIKERIRYYVQPECQSLDPDQSKEVQHRVTIRNDLHTVIDKELTGNMAHKTVMLLADTGMGNTTFLFNYFVHYVRKPHKSFRMEFIPFGFGSLKERLKSIPLPKKTILLLDAFDEDSLAIKEPVRRLMEIMEWTKDFHRVVMTCRTEFFPGNEDWSKRSEPTNEHGDRLDDVLYRLYLSPLNDVQIQTYLQQRYAIWHRKRRKKAQGLLDQMASDIPLRPIFFPFLDDLIHSNQSFKNFYQIYSTVFDAWLDREQRIANYKDNLRKFCIQVAIELLTHPGNSGAMRIPLHEIEPIARLFHIPLSEWKPSDRSLILRDRENCFKFRHRSILEFLFAEGVILNDERTFQLPVEDWTEMVKDFVFDGLDGKPWRFPIYFLPFSGPGIRMAESGKRVQVKPFEISIYPITNREYEEFDPDHCEKRDEYSDKDDQPVVNISYEDAERYCHWLSEKLGRIYRLPNEAEWEFAASGGGRRLYPWGNDKPDDERANYMDSEIMKTVSVCSYPQGMTPEGLYHLAGNVWEWCDDWFDEKKQSRVIRGGSFYDLEENLRCGARLGFDRKECVPYIGFRIVREV